MDMMIAAGAFLAATLVWALGISFGILGALLSCFRPRPVAIRPPDGPFLHASAPARAGRIE